MKHIFFIFSFLLICISCTKKTSQFELLESLVKEQVLIDAKKFLYYQPITVTDSFSERSAGTRHDFYSEGDYWWPDSENPEGPYIRKDGLTNPNNFVAHRKAMIRLSRISGALASAYLTTKDKKYLAHLMPHLQAWFVNESTKMNPHLLYAQAIKGRVTGRGIGIIDTIHLIEVALAVEVMANANLFPKEEIENIKNWFASYLTWLTTHEYGIKECDHGNNHSTCWTMEVAAFARLTNNKKQTDFCKNLFKNTLLPNQMAKDGSFPKELARTKPYGYALFNLDAMTSLAQLLSKNEEEDLFQFTVDGKSLALGISFLYPYVKDKKTWPYKQDVMYWKDWPTKHPFLIFGGFQLQKDEYLKTFETLPKIPNKEEIIRNMPVRYPLLWIEN